MAVDIIARGMAGNGGSGGVDQSYVDAQDRKTLNDAKSYTNETAIDYIGREQQIDFNATLEGNIITATLDETVSNFTFTNNTGYLFHIYLPLVTLTGTLDNSYEIILKDKDNNTININCMFQKDITKTSTVGDLCQIQDYDTGIGYSWEFYGNYREITENGTLIREVYTDTVVRETNPSMTGQDLHLAIVNSKLKVGTVVMCTTNYENNGSAYYAGRTYKINGDYSTGELILSAEDITVNTFGTIIVDDIKCKQLLDKYNPRIVHAYPDGSTKQWIFDNNGYSFVIEVKPNKDYTISKPGGVNIFNVSSSISMPAEGGSATNLVDGASNEIHIRTGENDKYLIGYFAWSTEPVNVTQLLDNILVEEGTAATSYTDYKKFGYNSQESMGKIVVDNINSKNKWIEQNLNTNASSYDKGVYNYTETTNYIRINISQYSVGLNPCTLNVGDTITYSFEIYSPSDFTINNIYFCTGKNGAIATNYESGSIQVNSGNHIISNTIYVNNQTDHIGFVIDGNIPSGTKISNIQVEEGSTATPYIPYLNMQELQEKTNDTGWIELSLINGATSIENDRKLSYRKIGNIVYLSGTIIPPETASSSAVIIAYLPSGCRPHYTYESFIIRNNNGSCIAGINFSTIDGAIWIQNATNGETSFSNVSFVADN